MGQSNRCSFEWHQASIFVASQILSTMVPSAIITLNVVFCGKMRRLLHPEWFYGCSEKEEGHLVMKSQGPKSATDSSRQGKPSCVQKPT